MKVEWPWWSSPRWYFGWAVSGYRYQREFSGRFRSFGQSFIAVRTAIGWASGRYMRKHKKKQAQRRTNLGPRPLP